MSFSRETKAGQNDLRHELPFCVFNCTQKVSHLNVNNFVLFDDDE